MAPWRLGQTLVILTGGIDLSNGMIMALSSVLMTGLAVQSGLSPMLAILMGLLAGVVFGVVNGALITAIYHGKPSVALYRIGRLT